MLTIKRKIITLTVLSLIGFGGISYVSKDTFNQNTNIVQNIQTSDYPLMDSASLNKIYLEQLSEKFTLSVTLGDEELLIENKETFNHIIDGLSQQKKLNPLLINKINKIESNLNKYFNVSYDIANGIINETIDFTKISGMTKSNV